MASHAMASRARWPVLLRAALVLAVSLVGCSTTTYRAKFVRPNDVAELDHKDDFLKCHMSDGSLYVFNKWSVSGEGDEAQVAGHGLFYDASRGEPTGGNHTVRVKDVALFETNQPEKITRTGGVVGMGIVTGASLLVTVACLSNPKACFGSCPTFYVDDGSGKLALQAEGFSSSVARVLEATDVDAMWTARASGSTLDVLMTNDALETHAVKSVRVIAVARPKGARVYRAGDSYRPASRLTPPASCSSPLGDCRGKLGEVDGDEWMTTADEHDLAAKEAVYLTFPRGQGTQGIVIHARNSLLNTFVFYQLLAYMGRSAGELVARFERSGSEAAEGWKAFGRRLGDIEVEVLRKDGTWAAVGAFAEVGPIAKEVQLVVLPDELPEKNVEVRLTLAKGNWKVDQVVLADIGPALAPERIEPFLVLRRGKPDAVALARLRSEDRHLVTYPGDAYTLRFAIPDSDVELFLESRGFYYEWIRTQWLVEEDPSKALQALTDPDGLLRRLAPLYKKVEGKMEAIFWSSKVGARP